ncbi:hypothetical protein HDU96_001243 [Phlyctochytrium bullatum]|nr:hypothetical protein HDU96_001243 [Phlyctochytrium bullatum]
MSDLKKRRQRATSEQLLILEEVFRTTPNPPAPLRKELAERCGMRERSVQIWFQNRRARSRPHTALTKRKLLVTTSLSTSTPSTLSTPTSSSTPTPTSAMSLLTPLAHTPLTWPPTLDTAMPSTTHMAPPPPTATFLPTPPTPTPPITHLPITSLTIGTWRRTLDPHRRDLLAGANTPARALQFVIECANTGFRIEVPYASIASLSLHDISPDIVEAEITLVSPPAFCMQVEAPGGEGRRVWIRCSDFTEGGQGTSVGVQRVRGPRAPLVAALAAACVADAGLWAVAGAEVVRAQAQGGVSLSPMVSPMVASVPPAAM